MEVTVQELAAEWLEPFQLELEGLEEQMQEQLEAVRR